MRRFLDFYAGAVALWLTLWRLLGDANGWLALANAWSFWLLLTGIPVGTVALMRRSRVLAFLWAVASGATFVRHYSGLLARLRPSSSVEAVAGDQVTVFSANLLNRPRILDQTAQAILDLNADLLLFQECIADHSEQLERSLACNYAYRAWIPYLPTNMGLGIAGRIPFAVTGFWQNVGLEPYALRIALVLPGGPLDVYCVHFIAPSHQVRRRGPTRLLHTREQQIRTILREIARRSRPAIVAGDWNSTEGADSYGWASSQLIDGWLEGGDGPGWTWQRLVGGRDFFPLLRLDYLFHTGRALSRRVQVMQMQRILDPRIGSDHCPLMAQISVTPSRR